MFIYFWFREEHLPICNNASWKNTYLTSEHTVRTLPACTLGTVCASRWFHVRVVVWRAAIGDC